MKKNYNKTLLTLLMMSSVTSLTACGGGNDSDSPKPKPDTYQTYSLKSSGISNFYSPEKIPFTLSKSTTSSNLSLSSKSPSKSSFLNSTEQITNKTQLITLLNQTIHSDEGNVINKNLKIIDIDFTNKGAFIKLSNLGTDHYYNFENITLSLKNNQKWSVTSSITLNDASANEFLNVTKDSHNSLKIDSSKQSNAQQLELNHIRYYDANLQIILDIDTKKEGNSSQFTFTNCDIENSDVKNSFDPVVGLEDTHTYQYPNQKADFKKPFRIIFKSTKFDSEDCKITYKTKDMKTAYLLKKN